MAQKNNTTKEETGLRCAKCRHLESEHGSSGSRPCMAVVGELGDREFCACDEFSMSAVMAA